MSESFVQIPTDSSNTGKLIRTNQRTVNGSTVEEHFMILQDYTNDNQASIDSNGNLATTGSIVSLPNVTINNVSTIGSLATQNVVGSVVITSPVNVEVTVGDNISVTPSGVFGVNINNFSDLGSNRVITNFSDLGSNRVITNFSDLGSNRVITNFSDLGSSRIITAGSVQVVNPYNGSVTSLPNVTINNVSTIGSLATQNVVGSVVNNQVSPIDTSQNNAYYKFEYVTSGTSTGVTGSRIGSITQFIGAGSYVQVWQYNNNNIINIGSWS